MPQWLPGRLLRETATHSAAPAMIEARLAACAFVKPKNERGLMRMNSTRNLATPDRIKYAANTLPGRSHNCAFQCLDGSCGEAKARPASATWTRTSFDAVVVLPIQPLSICRLPSFHKIKAIAPATINS